jgi:hypothetical protein
MYNTRATAISCNYGLFRSSDVNWVYEFNRNGWNTPHNSILNVNIIHEILIKAYKFIYHSETGLQHGNVLRVFIMELVRIWWLLLFVRAVAENQPFCAYNFTLETCTNACVWKMINHIQQKNHRQNKIAQNFLYQYTDRTDFFRTN